jgi:hypothetical protein
VSIEVVTPAKGCHPCEIEDPPRVEQGQESIFYLDILCLMPKVRLCQRPPPLGRGEFDTPQHPPLAYSPSSLIHRLSFLVPHEHQVRHRRTSASLQHRESSTEIINQMRRGVEKRGSKSAIFCSFSFKKRAFCVNLR